MHFSRERPFGVSAIAVLVAINGLASLAMALDLFMIDLSMSTHADVPGAGVELVTGSLLLYRAFGLLRLHHLPWLMTIILLAVNGATAAGELVFGTRTAIVWLTVVLAVGADLYLLQPGVRELFSTERASQ
jgi:hypothetical protein